MPSLIDSAKNFVNDPVGATFTRARFFTAYTPPVELTAAQLKALIGGETPPPPAPPPGSAPPPAVVQKAQETYAEQLKPTLTIESPIFGSYTYAPHGEVGEEDWKRNLTRMLLIGGTAFIAYSILVYSIGYRRGSRATG